MEHNKEQSGAVASEKPQFPWNPDPINHEWTQREIEVIRAYGQACCDAGVQSRAADAPSEPSESLCAAVMNIPCARTMSQFVRVPEMVAYKEGHRDALCAVIDVIAAVKSRAADALDSQPTELKPSDYFGDTIFDGNLPESEADAIRKELAQRTQEDRLNEIQGASSQPTDGGVRNG